MMGILNDYIAHFVFQDSWNPDYQGYKILSVT